MPELRLITPEELKNSKNPAAGQKTDRLKTPQEYGIPYIKDLYRKLRNDFFVYMAENYPEDVEITFSNSDDYLGRFICDHTVSRDQNGNVVGFSFEKPQIDFSNNFRLTPYELVNVLAHEMIHLEQASQLAGEDGQETLEYYQGDIDRALGHEEFFDMEAQNINRDYNLGVTAVCDDPTMKDSVKPTKKIESKYFISKTIGQNETALVSLPNHMVGPFIHKHLGDISQYRIFICKDEAVNEKYGHPDENTGRKTTIPTTLFNQYIASGIFDDCTRPLVGIIRSNAEEEDGPANTVSIDSAKTGRSYLVLVMDDVDKGMATVYGLPHNEVPKFVTEHTPDLMQQRLFAGYTTKPYFANKYGTTENAGMTEYRLNSQELKELLDDEEFINTSSDITDKLVSVMRKHMEEAGGYSPKACVVKAGNQTLVFIADTNVDETARHIAQAAHSSTAVYDITDPESVKLPDGEVDSETIAGMVRDGHLRPLFTVMPNGTKVQ